MQYISVNFKKITVIKTSKQALQIKTQFLKDLIMNLYLVVFAKTLILCYLCFVTIELTDGKPQILHSNASSPFQLQAVSPLPLITQAGTIGIHLKPVISEITHQKRIWEENEEDLKFAIQHTALYNVHLVQNSILFVSNSRSVVKGHTAPLIVSSFQNTYNQKSAPKDESNEAQLAESSPKKISNTCQSSTLERCIDELPPMNDTGLPCSHEAVNRACRIYDSGIACFESWAKNCLPKGQRQKAKGSITGVEEVYSFLCKDVKFRKDYLKHAHCYKQLSPYWDDCSRQFRDGLWRNRRFNFTAFCCIRLEFVSCVYEYSSHLCSLDATKFVMKIAETLVRPRTRGHSTDCSHLNPKQCVPIVENGVARSGDVFLLVFALASVIVTGSRVLHQNVVK